MRLQGDVRVKAPHRLRTPEPMWGFRFTLTSFFPNIELSDIWDIEFHMTNALNIPFDYDRWEYYEFVYRWEKLVDERKRENSEANQQEGRMALNNLGVHMDQMKGLTQ